MYNRITLATDKGKDKPKDPSETFSNFADSQDSKVAAKYLSDKGLVGANQLVFENQKTGNADEITNQNQSDWKIAAAQKILQKAYQKNMRNPAIFLAPENRDYLLSGVDPRVKAAINNPTFNQVHPNFWQVLGNQVLPEQWSKEDANNKNQVATK